AETREAKTLQSKIVIAAMGSWEENPIEEMKARAFKGSDLFAFKAHFSNVPMSDGLMPLLSFQDGYGGMARCQNGLTSLSCCIRVSRLNTLPHSANEAGERVFEHIKGTCPAIVPLFDGAERIGAWLGAGPIRPGIRKQYDRGIF